MQRQHIKGKTRKALLSEIRNRISTGENRQNIFDDLSTKYAEQDWLASLIAGVPNPEDVQRLEKRTSFIFFSLCAYAVIHTISIVLFMLSTLKANTKLIFILPLTLRIAKTL